MQKSVLSVCKQLIAGCFFTAFSMSALASDNSISTSITEMDLSSLSQEAHDQGKRLMLIYTEKSCDNCSQFTEQLAKSEKMRDFYQDKFQVYETYASQQFNVTCPAGEELSEAEFVAMKGIISTPAYVFFDTEGNVIHVQNGSPEKQDFVALGEFILGDHYLDYASVAEWKKTLQLSVKQ